MKPNVAILTAMIMTCGISYAAYATETKLVAPAQTIDDFLNALQKVETGSSPNQGEGVLGDNGKALGPLQIHEACWKDAVEFDPSIGGSYQDCSGWEYSKKIAKAYLKRYANGASFEKMARIWNGGPSIYKRKASKAWAATTVYWEKVRKHLDN